MSIFSSFRIINLQGTAIPKSYERRYCYTDLNKVRYDLALLYAKSKFDHALANNEITSSSPISHPEYLDEVPFLLKAFETAYYDLENYDILSDDQ